MAKQNKIVEGLKQAVAGDWARATIYLPLGKYVVMTQGGGGEPNRLIIQFQDMADMHKATKGFVECIARHKP